MTPLLHQKDDIGFYVSDTFESRFLVPHLENMRDKMLKGEWDDYNELYHASRLIHDFAAKGLSMAFHTMRLGEEMLGMLIITHGDLEPDIYSQSGLRISDPVHEIALLNYFHIAPAGRGNGTFWLRDIVMPLYADLGYRTFYLKTSHPRVFPLYDRLGAVVGHYTHPSDNGRHMRTGRIYRLPLIANTLPKD